MKYIVIKIKDGIACPIIFPNFLVHAEVMKFIGAMLNNVHRRKKVEAVSAGDVRIDGVTCSGKSETLNLESRGRSDVLTILGADYASGVIDAAPALTAEQIKKWAEDESVKRAVKTTAAMDKAKMQSLKKAAKRTAR